MSGVAQARLPRPPAGLVQRPCPKGTARPVEAVSTNRSAARGRATNRMQECSLQGLQAARVLPNSKRLAAPSEGRPRGRALDSTFNVCGLPKDCWGAHPKRNHLCYCSLASQTKQSRPPPLRPPHSPPHPQRVAAWACRGWAAPQPPATAQGVIP